MDTHEDVSDRFILKPTIEDIVKVTSVEYGVNISNLYHSQRGKRNIPRLMVILIARKYFGYKRRGIAEIMKIKSIKTVTSCVERIEKIIKEEPALTVKRDKILRVLK